MRKFFLFLFCLLCVGKVCAASATDFWISQNGSGSADGSSSSNAAACDATANTPQSTCAAFNNSSNWGSSSSQIGAGTTIHLVGSITASAGADGYLQFQGAGSGSGASRITLYWETGAALHAAYWGSSSGAIDTAGNAYLLINGGPTCGWEGITTGLVACNGLIDATANGTGLANQQSTQGMKINNSDHVEVENLHVGNIYVRTCTLPSTGCTGDFATGSSGIRNFPFGGQTDVKIHNVIVDNANTCIDIPYEGSNSGIQVYNFDVSYCGHAVAIGDGSTSASESGPIIHDGHMSYFENWNSGASDYTHSDGVFLFTVHDSSTMSDPLIYNLLIQGPWGDCCGTSPVFMDGLRENSSSTGLTNPIIFNIIVDNTTGGTNTPQGLIEDAAGNNVQYYHVTLLGTPATADLVAQGNTTSYTGITLENSIIASSSAGFSFTPPATWSAFNYNDWYSLTEIGNYYMGATYTALTDWQASSGSPDANSITTNPALSSYQPSVSLAGTNLYSFAGCASPVVPGIGAMCYDIAGNARPSSGAWEMGAYNKTSSVPTNSLFMFYGTP